jgi:GTP-binding protein HflX
MRTLSELDIEKDKMIYALNKADLVKSEEIERKIDILDLTKNKKWVSVSAKTGENVNQLKELIKDIMTNQNSPKFEKNILEGVEKEFGN